MSYELRICTQNGNRTPLSQEQLNKKSEGWFQSILKSAIEDFRSKVSTAVSNDHQNVKILLLDPKKELCKTFSCIRKAYNTKSAKEDIAHKLWVA